MLSRPAALFTKHLRVPEDECSASDVALLRHSFVDVRTLQHMQQPRRFSSKRSPVQANTARSINIQPQRRKPTWIWRTWWTIATWSSRSRALSLRRCAGTFSTSASTRSTACWQIQKLPALGRRRSRCDRFPLSNMSLVDCSDGGSLSIIAACPLCSVRASLSRRSLPVSPALDLVQHRSPFLLLTCV